MKVISWPDILDFAASGNPPPPRLVEKSEAEWQKELSAEQYAVTRQCGTEIPFTSPTCEQHKSGRYACVCCGQVLFDATEKFESGTGWPSFTSPLSGRALAYRMDLSHDITRVEVCCNCCQAHLGHVFPDGPEPTRLRYCLNGVALKKITPVMEKVTFGGGCFWCTEAMFQQLNGVESAVSGYSGGTKEDPTYPEVCSGETGHAEVVEITYDPALISYEELLRVHLGSHDPTTLNRQGADVGTQYRSVIFYRSEEEKGVAERVVADYASATGSVPVTEIVSFQLFYPAEDMHQNYYRENTQAGYCEAVISPKLSKFRQSYLHLFREG